MTEPLKFLHRIPAWTGGKEAIFAAARQALADGYAKPAADATRKVWQKWAVNLIVHAIKAQLREPLEHAIERHLAAVEEEHILLEGDAPAVEDPAFEEWNRLLNEATEKSFQGDMLTIISSQALKSWIYSDKPTSNLVDLLLAMAVQDTGNAFSRLEIKPGDIDSLIPTPLEAVISKTHGSPELDSDAEKLKALGADPGPTLADLEFPPARRRAPSIESPTPYTEAAKGCLIALRDHTKVKDEVVAKALGVSRGSVIGYREGKTLWSPTPEQDKALHDLMQKEIDELTASLEALKP